jgi:hypothetical protein
MSKYLINMVSILDLYVEAINVKVISLIPKINKLLENE